jgi:hypothetical protein
MRSRLSFAAIILAIAALVPLQFAAAQLGSKKSLRVFLASVKEKKPTTNFSADVPTIYAIWQGQALEVGDKIRVVWIAEDVGEAAPKHDKILEGNATVLKPNEGGDFSLSRPGGKTWPIGKYTVELYINGTLAELAHFNIEPGVTIDTH